MLEIYAAWTGWQQLYMRVGTMMMSFNDAVDFFREVAGILDDAELDMDDDFAARYTCAMNRLRYECGKSIPVETKKIKKIRGPGYIVSCGNCGTGLSMNSHYKYCPDCGHAVKK